MRELKEMRDEIDEIDKQFVKLFEKRMTIVEEVAAYKLNYNLAIKDERREAALIKKNLSLLKNHKYDDLLTLFIKDIMAYSVIHQNKLMRASQASQRKATDFVKVAYQGIEGSFSSLALNKYFGENVEKIQVLKFEDAFKLLQSQAVEFIIMPIENSSTGTINEVYDLLKKYYASIVGEVYLKREHHLIGCKGASLATIREVYSHEQAFKQSTNFLHGFKWHQYTYYNTAKSVEHVSTMNRIDFAAIGSEEAAKRYGLEIIKRSIQNSHYNSTRFIILSQEPLKVDHANKISLIIKIPHEPDSLFNILDKISGKNVNMLKIESRPVADKPWEYLFYLDIEGSLEDEGINGLLKEIEGASNMMLLLGNYYSEKCENGRK